MLAHHIVVQHKLNKHCVQRLVSSTRFSKLLFSVLSTPRLSFLSFYVLLCTYSSSSVLVVLFCPNQSFYVVTSPFPSLLVRQISHKSGLDLILMHVKLFRSSSHLQCTPLSFLSLWQPTNLLQLLIGRRNFLHRGRKCRKWCSVGLSCKFQQSVQGNAY